MTHYKQIIYQKTEVIYSANSFLKLRPIWSEGVRKWGDKAGKAHGGIEKEGEGSQ
jgi:hypothetical protein